MGRIVSSLIGLAWNLATFLVVPVLVVEKVGPVDAVKRSAQLLKRTWGEQFVGNLSIGLVFFLIGIVVALIGIPIVVVALGTGSAVLVGLAVLLLVLALISVGLVSSTLSGIYAAAVYRYAVEADTGGYFSTDLVQGAFRPK